MNEITYELIKFYLIGSAFSVLSWIVFMILSSVFKWAHEDAPEMVGLLFLMFISSWFGLAAQAIVFSFFLLYHGLLIIISGTIYLLIQLGLIIYDNFKRRQNERALHNKSKK